MDAIATYAASKGWTLRRCIVLVEGTTDEALFKLTDQLAAASGAELLGNDISIIAAGDRERGGTFGVGRELIALRALAPYILDIQGEPVYRTIGLLDDDYAGRKLVEDIVNVDRGVLEFRDIFRVRPVMPLHLATDAIGRRQVTDLHNLPFIGMDWEVEDIISSALLDRFELANSSAVVSKETRGGRTHREFTRPGKSSLHRFVQRHATLEDLSEVVGLMRALRSLFGLPSVP